MIGAGTGGTGSGAGAGGASRESSTVDAATTGGVVDAVRGNDASTAQTTACAASDARRPRGRRPGAIAATMTPRRAMGSFVASARGSVLGTAAMSARHLLLDSPAMGRKVHLWTYGEVGRPLVVFPSNAGVAHEWQKSGMIDALAPLLAAGRMKIYCPETNVSRSFSGKGSMDERIAHHHAYERFVLETLVPFIRNDSRTPDATMTATGCSVGALYASLFVLKHPETFSQALCLSGRYRASKFFDGRANTDVYYNDPLAFVPNLEGAALQRVRARAHLVVVVGRGAHEDGCIPETTEFGTWLQRKEIPNHVALWGHDSRHDYTWWARQASHYLNQLF